MMYQQSDVSLIMRAACKGHLLVQIKKGDVALLCVLASRLTLNRGP